MYLCHQDLDPVHELLVRAGVLGEHLVLLHEVNLDVEFIETHPVLDVAVETVGLLDEDDPAGGLLPQEGDHFTKCFPASLLRGLDVREFLDNLKVMNAGVIAEELELGRDRVAFLFLLLRADTGVDDGVGALARRARR